MEQIAPFGQLVGWVGAPAAVLLVVIYWYLHRKSKIVGGDELRSMEDTLDRVNGKLIPLLVPKLRESMEFKELISERIRVSHELKNVQSAQSTLTRMHGDLRTALEEHRKEDTEAHEQIGELRATVASLKDEFVRTVERVEERMTEEGKDTRTEIKSLSSAVTAQTGEFKLLKQLLERRLRPRD